MKHIKLLAYACEQAEKDLQSGYGVGYQAPPVNVLVQPFPIVDAPGCYQVLAKANNHVGVLLHPCDDFLDNLLTSPDRVEGYLSLIRTNAWRWAHSEDARSLVLATNQEPG